jgi:hypothetical protein
MTAIIDWKKGEIIRLLARYKDAGDYSACEFYETSVGSITTYLVQYSGGSRSILQQAYFPYNQAGGDGITLSMTVQGTQGACAFNNHVINGNSTGNALDPSSGGRIGFAAWDVTPGNAEMIVHRLEVDQD